MIERTNVSLEQLKNTINQFNAPILITDCYQNLIHSNPSYIQWESQSDKKETEDVLKTQILDEIRLNSSSISFDLFVMYNDQEERIIICYQDVLTVDTGTVKMIQIIPSSYLNENHELLNHLESQLKTMFNYHPDVIFMINQEGYFTDINQAGAKLIERSLLEIQHMTYLDIIHPDDHEQANDHFQKVLKNIVLPIKLSILSSSGTKISMDITAVPVRNNDKFNGIIGIGKDVTKQVKIEDELQASEQRYRTLFINNVDAVLTFDLEGNYLDINPATEAILGYTHDELMNENFLPHIVPDFRLFTQEMFKKALNGETVQYETKIMTKTKKIIDAHITLIPMEISGVINGIHCIGKDITVQKRVEKKLSDMAFHDYLTKLPNQHYLAQYLKELMESDKFDTLQFAMMFFDLDRFKSINDTFGHEFGDAFLKAAADRLTLHLPNDATLFRYGGDEYIVVLPFTNPEEVNRAAQIILNETRKPFFIESIEVTTTASVGISIFPDDAYETNKLIQQADHAMYVSKRNGKNQIQWFQNAKTQIKQTNYKLEPALKKALSNREFHLVYQPQIHLKTREIIGFEALIRWNNPEFGVIPPNEFIPLAEEAGVIVDIGKWVIRQTCKDLATWKKHGLFIAPVSVNVSIHQFFQYDFTEHLMSEIVSHHIEASLINVEITESIASNADFVTSVLRNLQELGVKVAIDDFGTGYSSLSYLKEFPINFLKIDRSFIMDIERGEKDRDIVDTIINLSHNLKLQSIAEGAETQFEIDFLQSKGCDIVQGYYFSPPLTAVEIQKWISAFLKNR